MLGFFLYVGATSVIAAMLTVLWVMMQPIRTRGEIRSWRTYLFSWSVITFVPYLWGEILTYLMGKEMYEPVTEVVREVVPKSDLRFFRVVSYLNGQARVVAVGEEPIVASFTERFALAMTLVRENNVWKAESYEIVYSPERNRDGVTLPPYW